ncbi:MAG: phosphoribosyltransferase [Desulfomonilia bacterium]|jgi:putative phosphoribosyl transferase|uniref:Putative phosphoribosyl transferase n=1 Tax=anaerobic digester metagenome TaxID=1263854 RepID=A0A485LYD7_9ZZZZ|nr:phosphoribosyltransferase family protein [Pseudomonadota bacterium]HON38013.1 phosphoribosyltransferase family protein [Deltaproteobacteria bacterium]HPD20747.1 phosphoribosyltransferase family protein [Deltaproteobacteria bacterium]HRS55030.1 phosphoribosyltransferase family protein [Desulfomonilia bacterium]HRV35262.1 phosphoribosyltransferase family protein [Desulfomonilia bacterium]
MGTLVITSRSEEPFMDRYEAGMALGNRLLNSADESTVVLGIPRGGVIVARGIARILGADLDIVLTRRMGAPDNPELTIGALSEDGQLFLDAGLSMRAGVDEAYIEQEKAYQMSVILQMAGRYRKVRPKIPLEGRTVVITDEGAADGSTLQASLWAVRKERPARLIVAVPVGSIDALMGLADDADETIALKVPPVLRSVGRFYVRFEKTTDEEVVEALRTSAQGSA